MNAAAPYIEQLDCVYAALIARYRGFINREPEFLQHDNAPPTHAAALILRHPTITFSAPWLVSFAAAGRTFDSLEVVVGNWCQEIAS